MMTPPKYRPDEQLSADLYKKRMAEIVGILLNVADGRDLAVAQIRARTLLAELGVVTARELGA